MNNYLIEIINGKGEKPISTKMILTNHRIRISAALTIFIAILLTSLIGCAPATPIVVTLPTVQAVVPTETTTIPTNAPTETPTLIPTETPFIPKATIKIALHVPLSGGGSRDGAEMVRAAELAVQQLSGPLNELGYGIELEAFDDQSNVEASTVNAREIIADPAILCGVGHINSNVMVQASEVYHLGGLAFITPSSTSATVTDRYYPEVNRIIGRDDGQGMAGAQFAQTQGFTRVYVIHSNASASEKSADYFMQEAYRVGVSVVAISATDQKENFEGMIRRLMSANPDLVYFAGRYDQAGPFFREARAAGYTGAFMGTDLVNRPDMLELAGPSSVEGGGLYYTEVAAPANNYPNAAQFINDFDLTYGDFPRDFAPLAYDAIGMCIKALEEASKAKGGELPTRKEVATAVRNLMEYQGVTGTYSFDNKGDSTLAKYFVFKVLSPDPANWDQNPVVASFLIQPPR